MILSKLSDRNPAWLIPVTSYHLKPFLARFGTLQLLADPKVFPGFSLQNNELVVVRSASFTRVNEFDTQVSHPILGVQATLFGNVGHCDRRRIQNIVYSTQEKIVRPKGAVTFSNGAKRVFIYSVSFVLCPECFDIWFYCQVSSQPCSPLKLGCETWVWYSCKRGYQIPGQTLN